MSKPAARIGDMHVCPLSTGPVPHVGGPVTGPGAPIVLIGGMPAAVLGDMLVCTGPPDVIALGSSGVMIGGKPAARMGDMTAHGGSIVAGCPTVLIGEVGMGTANPAMGGVGTALANTFGRAKASAAPFAKTPCHQGQSPTSAPLDTQAQKQALAQASKHGQVLCKQCQKA